MRKIKIVSATFLLIILFSAAASCSIATHITDKGIILNQKLVDNGSLREKQVYFIQEHLNLRGKELVIPKNCQLVFSKGSFNNGLLRLSDTQVDGSVDLRCRTSGSVKNDTIMIWWFNYTDHALADAFSMSNSKVLVFDEKRTFRIDYAFLIPSCHVLGNGCTIVLGNTQEGSKKIPVAKIRNAHYDGEGVDSFTMQGLNFVTESDSLFLFNMQNTKNCSINNCSFTCKGTGKKLSHVVDLRGNNKVTRFENCRFVNESDATEGGGLWIRAFNEIQDVQIKNCFFFNNCTDEILALIATNKNITEVRVENSQFVYQRGKNSPEPHVMWTMAQSAGKIKDVIFDKCSLRSDYIPSFVISAKKADDVVIRDCSFNFDGAWMNKGGLVTTAFNGTTKFDSITLSLKDINRQDEKTSLSLFGSQTMVTKSQISNNCSGIFLGGPKIFDSTIDFDNSQLFNSRVPSRMERCKIYLGKGTPRLAVNPYAQDEECEWRDNVIESGMPVDFNLSYKKNYLRAAGNQMKNVRVQGVPFKK